MPDPSCPRCSGSGWVVIERGGLSGADRCACAAATRPQALEDRANLPPLYANASLDNFALPQDNPVAMNALAGVLVMVKKYANEFPATDKPGLLFLGDPGCGKTHLAVAVLRILLSKGFEGLFFDYQNLLDRIRSGYDASSGASDREAFRTALDTEVLLLDDLGAHRVTDWVEDTVTSIITYRCNHRKPLIATTNLVDAEAGMQSQGRTELYQRVGPRARSRLFEMCKIIRMPQVEDYRMKRARG